MENVAEALAKVQDQGLKNANADATEVKKST